MKIVVPNVKVKGVGKVWKVPSLAKLEKLAAECVVPAVDGCKVEPDGYCEHGWPSALVAAGVI